MIILMHVVLPAPFGPITPYNAPRGTVSDMPSTAFVAPNDFRTSRRTSAGSMNILLWRVISRGGAVAGVRESCYSGRNASPVGSCCGSCSSSPAVARTEAPAREYQLQGQILAVRPERSEVVIKHEDIKGFMPGMTMPFKVKEGALLQGKEPGDLVTATLVVGEVEAHLAHAREDWTRSGRVPRRRRRRQTSVNRATP